MALVNCSECGTQISDKAATCPHCGAPVVKLVVCPECGNKVKEGASICPNCGYPMGGHKTAKQKLAGSSTSNNWFSFIDNKDLLLYLGIGLLVFLIIMLL